MSGPSLTSHYLTLHPLKAAPQSSFKWLGSPRAAMITKLLAFGEIFGDKLPMTPNRTAPGPLLGRIVIGGYCGAALCAAEGKRPVVGAVLGAAAAIGGAFGFYYLRRYLGQGSKIPDPIWGTVEDTLVYGSGVMILR